MSLLTSPTPFGAVAAARRRAAPLPPLLPLRGRAALHVAFARRGGVSSRTQRRLEERGGKKRRGGVAAPDVDEEALEAGAAEWEGEPLGFEVSTEPMPDIPNPETPDFWEGQQWEALGFFVQYMWAFGVVFGVSKSSFAVGSLLVLLIPCYPCSLVKRTTKLYHLFLSKILNIHCLLSCKR